METFKVNDVSFSNNNNMLLENINIEFSANNSYALLGRKSSGKEILLAILAGLKIADNGYLSIDENKIENLDLFRQKYCTLILKEPELIESYTIYENLALAMSTNRLKPNKALMKQIVRKLGLKETILEQKPTSLTLIEQYKISFIRAFIRKTPIIIVDDITTALDDEAAGDLMQILIDYCRKDEICIIIATEQNNIASYCENIIGISHGEINYLKYK